MRWIVIAVVMLLGLGSVGHAKPMFSTLADIVKESKTVVIARYHLPAEPFKADEYELLVERALAGHVKPGAVLRVAPSPSGHAAFANDTRLVAFVNGKNEWIAAATLADGTGKTLETGVLHVSGFFDFNAFLVSPSSVTLAQLEPYVARGTPMTWKFRGPILVGTPSGLAPSKLVLTATAPANAISGIAAKGFPAAQVTVGSGMGEDAYVTWQRTLDRPFALEGDARSVDPDGTIVVEWRTQYPELIGEAELAQYLANPKLGHPYFELVLEKPSGNQKVILGDEIGRIGKIGGREISGISTAPTRSISLGPDEIALGPPRKGFVAHSHEQLVEEAMTGPIACTYAGKEACTLRYVRTYFASR